MKRNTFNTAGGREIRQGTITETILRIIAESGKNGITGQKLFEKVSASGVQTKDVAAAIKRNIRYYVTKLGSLEVLENGRVRKTVPKSEPEAPAEAAPEVNQEAA